jgi:hypothetical protein
MSTILKPFRNLFSPVKPLPAGSYHFQAPQEDPRNYRLHLRVEEDGCGLLIVNASTVLHLNETATEYAFYFINNTPAAEVAHNMSRRYNVDPEQASEDYRNFNERVLILIEIPDLDPITFLDFNRQEPYSGTISAPYRVDCALTYQLPESHDPGYAPTKRVARELTTEEWLKVLDKTWHAGIPHVIFTGGEPTLREDLPRIIEHVEVNGQVSGLLTDGLRLADKDYFDSLLQTGLDHLLILLHPEIETTWKSLNNILENDIFTAVHLTITHQNAHSVMDYLWRLADIGVKDISLSTNTDELDPALETARNRIASLDMELVWDIPVPFSAHNPVAVEVESQEIEHPTGSGRAWIYIEPDGDVTPTQGDEQVLGNLLTDPWETIWTPS